VEIEKLIKIGNFREDLYYRLMVYPIYIPPLRMRKEDVPVLIHYIIKKLNNKYGRAVEKINEDALELMKDYEWPGNIRELENIIGRAIINMGFKETSIRREHLPPINIKRDAADLNQGIEQNISED